MVPRNEIAGLDLADDWQRIVAQLKRSPYTRLVVYRESMDQIVGFLHLRNVLNLMTRKPRFDRADLENLCREPYFIPETTTPVSYTHLDVYKRQIMSSSICSRPAVSTISTSTA